MNEKSLKTLALIFGFLFLIQTVSRKSILWGIGSAIFFILALLPFKKSKR